VKTLYQQVEKLFAFAEQPTKRIGTGIKAIDNLIRGPAPGEVCMILGRSFSGKSIFGQNIIQNNPNVPCIFFSMEMPYLQAVIRMYSMWSDTSSYENQDKLEQGKVDTEAWDMVLDFPNLIIDDRSSLGLDEMSQQLEDYEAAYKVRPEYVVVDYLELIGGAKASAEGMAAVESQATMLKDWSKSEEMRVFVLHQTNRLEKKWNPPTEDSARFGGYTEADFVLGMWRPHTDPDLDYWDSMAIKHHLNMNILKDRVFFQEKALIPLKIAPSGRILDAN